MIEIDHLFIFSNTQGNEANQLVSFGLKEGSQRVHPGQGTINRKFYFENFFLEILWVHNEVEIRSSLTEPTKLWKRAEFTTNDYARFGLCLANTGDTDAIFTNSDIYQPEFFPEGMSINFIAHEEAPHLPWTFRLPMKGNTQPKDEPRQHSNHLKKLTKATFGVDFTKINPDFIHQFENAPMVNFTENTYPYLWLEFDHHQQGQSKNFQDLALTILY
ncbi:MAG TPA: hypothetical protein DCS93_00205 [Microscillaceae bacterium]|nr:hypothetical protein [Microscillaceae bacterium]